MDTSGEAISVFSMSSMASALAMGGGAGAGPTSASAGAGDVDTATASRTGADDRPSSVGSIAPGGTVAASSSTSNLQIKKGIMKGDSLLRILGERAADSNNEVIVLAETGHLRAITSLVDRGFDWDSCRGLRNFTPLHYACRGGHAAVASELLRACPSLLHVSNDNGEVPLHLAVYGGHLLLAEQLLDRGTAVDAPTREGETALFYAARRAMPAAVRLLLQRGADPAHEDYLGDTPVDVAEDEHTRHAFESEKASARDCSSSGGSGSGGPSARLAVEELQAVMAFLPAEDVCRAACVCGKWHRVSESEDIWARLGVRRWEVALQNVLGLDHLGGGSLGGASSQFSRPPPKKKKSVKKAA